MRKQVFPKGNLTTGLDSGSQSTEGGLYKKSKVPKDYKPRGEGQGCRPTEK